MTYLLFLDIICSLFTHSGYQSNMSSIYSFFGGLFEDHVSQTITILIFIAFFVGMVCHALNIQQRFKEYIPAFMTALGILGTFIGIVYGLKDFDPENIDDSIPSLLNGLKTAFNTSIVGMGGTILFKLLTSFKVRKDKVEEIPEDEDLAPEILKTMKDQSDKFEKLILAIGSDGDNSLLSQTRLLRADLNDKSTTSLLEFKDFRKELSKQLDTFIEKMSHAASDQIIEALKNVITDFNNKLTEQFGENFKQLNEAVGKLVEWQKEYREHLVELESRYKAAVELLEQSKDAMVTIADTTQAIPKTMNNLDKLLTAQQVQIDDMDHHMETMAQTREKAVQAVPEIQKCVTTMTEELKSSINTVSEDIDSAVKNFSEHAKSSSESLKTFVKDASDKLVKTVSEATNNMETASEKTTSALASTAEKIVSSTEAISKNMNNFNTETKAAIENTITAIQKLQQQLVNTSNDASESIESAYTTFTNTANTMAEEAYNTAKDTITKNMTQVENAVGGIAKHVQEQINQDLKYLDEGMTKELNNALGSLGSALATIADTIADRYNRATKEGSRV